MTRKFQVIQNKYVVDKEAEIKVEDRFVIDEYNSSQYGVKTALIIGYDIIRSKEGWPQTFPIDKEKCVKLVAVIGEQNRIAGLPVIVFEELVTVNVPHDIPNTREEAGNYIRGYADGFRAKSKGYWTDEDIENTYNKGWKDKEDGEEYHAFGDKEADLAFIRKQPQITEIELEVEICHLKGEEMMAVKRGQRLKITSSTDKGDVILIQKP